MSDYEIDSIKNTSHRHNTMFNLENKDGAKTSSPSPDKQEGGRASSKGKIDADETDSVVDVSLAEREPEGKKSIISKSPMKKPSL